MPYVMIERYKKKNDFLIAVQNVIVFLVPLGEPCAVKAACTVLGRVWRLQSSHSILCLFYKTLPVHFSLFGALLAFTLYNFQSKLLFSLKISFLGKRLYSFLNRKWFFDKVYNEYFGQFFFKFSYSLSYKFVDRGIFEILGPTGLALVATSIGSKIHNLQTGSLYHLTLTILIGFTLLFGLRQFAEVVVSYMNPFWSDLKLLVLIFILFIFLISYSKGSETE